MAKRVTQAKSDPTLLLVLAAIGLVGLFVTRRYGLAPVLRTVNQALGIARVVRSAVVRRHGLPAGGPRAGSGPRCWPFQSPALERVAQVNMARIPRPPNEAPREPPPGSKPTPMPPMPPMPPPREPPPGTFAVGAPGAERVAMP